MSYKYVKSFQIIHISSKNLICYEILTIFILNIAKVSYKITFSEKTIP